jgi:hypothetical protein
VAAEADDPGIGRLLQVAGGGGLYLPELILLARSKINGVAANTVNP